MADVSHTITARGDLARRLREHAGKKLDGRTLQHTLTVDAEISLSALTMGLLKGVSKG